MDYNKTLPQRSTWGRNRYIIHTNYGCLASPPSTQSTDQAHKVEQLQKSGSQPGHVSEGGRIQHTVDAVLFILSDDDAGLG